METTHTLSSDSWVGKYLEAHFIRFEEHRHNSAFTSQEVAQAEHVSGHRVAKVVVGMSGQTPCLLVLPASCMVDLELARKSTGMSDLRFASEYEIEEYFPDCQVGAIPPLPKWKGVKLYMDPSMRHPGNFLFQAANHENVISMRFSDWYEIVNPIEVNLAYPPGPIPEGRTQQISTLNANRMHQ